MNNIDINTICGRGGMADQIKDILLSFDERASDITFKKGIYIYGSPGSGKTQFVVDLLTKLNYDVIKYDAGDVRNKTLIDTITSNNISSRNVLDMMAGRSRKIAIVMDEIDGMSSGDKGGITALIKLIRQKKTKKQKMETMSLNPIVCIGNYYVDKKMKELMKVCNVFELKRPTNNEIGTILNKLIPQGSCHTDIQKQSLVSYIQGDMRKLAFVGDAIHKFPDLMSDDSRFQSIFCKKSYNEDAKLITKGLINERVSIHDHNQIMNETDRTIVALLWHENIVDVLSKQPKSLAIPVYCKILQNMCFADYIDRITFQSQIWQFNEMSSLIKTFYNNKIYHDSCTHNPSYFQPGEVRFTKVLTKYSTEYNNMNFISSLSQELDMDKRDVVAFFQELRMYIGSDIGTNVDILNKVEKLFENYNISKLDIKRIYRFLDKNVRRDSAIIDDDDGEDNNL